MGPIPGSWISPGVGNVNPLQYSCLGKSHGQRSLAGCSPWGRKESDRTEQQTDHLCFSPASLCLKFPGWPQPTQEPTGPHLPLVFLVQNLGRNLTLTPWVSNDASLSLSLLPVATLGRGVFNPSSSAFPTPAFPGPVYLFACWDWSSWLSFTFQLDLLLTTGAQHMGPEPLLLTRTPKCVSFRSATEPALRAVQQWERCFSIHDFLLWWGLLCWVRL